jgi:hypothetical protein
MQRIEPVEQRGRAGLEDDRRLDFLDFAIAHRGNGIPTGSRGNLVGSEFLAAPGTEDDVRRAAHDFERIGEDSVATERPIRHFREHVVAARDADQLRDPADAAEQRLVPFLEIHARTPRQSARGNFDSCEVRLGIARVCVGAAGRADHRAAPAGVIENPGNAAVVRDPDLDAGRDEFARDTGLHVGETDREIGLEREDLVDPGARERGHLRFLATRARRTHGESRNADDARLLAERVQHFGRFLGQANDAPRTRAAHGYSSRRLQESPARSYKTRSCRRKSAPYQTSMRSGTTR